ncbi:hypothetical protein CLPUN_17610 [Clostridium puniceum]|uniref:Uncharacterized protein n=1 Tax=Clostridium puniceum TaxID=29367 RepID=A0A1S8TN25_9CLOT|nr:hypothetical protein CLPUN_17610 [Clostridium puniceum]
MSIYHYLENYNKVESVNKAMRCSNIKYGFAEYICEESSESTKVLFTCKK